MDQRNISRCANAHETALAQIDLATIALQATGEGRTSPLLRKDLQDLIAVSQRVGMRLKMLRGLQVEME